MENLEISINDNIYKWILWDERFSFLFLFFYVSEGLREYFTKYGDITEVMVMKDPTTRRSRWVIVWKMCVLLLSSSNHLSDMVKILRCLKAHRSVHRSIGWLCCGTILWALPRGKLLVGGHTAVSNCTTWNFRWLNLQRGRLSSCGSEECPSGIWIMIYGNDRRSSTWNLKALINGTIVFHARMYAFPLETQI